MAHDDTTPQAPDMPEDLSTLTDEDLAELEAAAVAAADAIDEDEPSDQDLEDLSALVAAILRIREERKAREAKAKERAEEAAAQRALIHGDADDSTEQTDEQAESTDVEAEGGVADGEAESTDVEAETEETAAEPEPVMAAAQSRTVALAAISRHQRTRQTPSNPAGVPVITAAAELPDHAAGSRLTSFDEVAEAFTARAAGLGVTSMGADAPRYRVARVAIDRRHQTSPSGADDSEVLDKACSETSDGRPLASVGAPGLVAAGWCAPSETDYDFFNIAGQGGLLDLPSVSIRRGGIRYPISPTLGDVTGALWTWTEDDQDDMLSGDPEAVKGCFRVPCATFEEARLIAEGLCVTAGNLTDAAWPEATRNIISLVMAAHVHRLNAAKIAAVVARAIATNLGTTGSPLAGPSDAFGDLMFYVGLQVQDYRDKFRMDDAVLEVVLPRWTKEVLRANLAMRSGVDLTNVSDATLMADFAARGVRVQFVQDWQSLGATDPVATYPGYVQFLIYAAGTFFEGVGPSLDLGVVRDSVLNSTNDHTAAWSEQTYLVGMRGHEARLVTVGLSVDGVTACCEGS